MPQTAADRRNARLRALALAAVPALLFVLAALPRVWAPDLAPYGPRQAAYVTAAQSEGVGGLLAAYADVSRPALALPWPALLQTPVPLATWAVIRGLLDALAVPALYVAARPLVGTPGAALAALLLAVSPLGWAAARDPAGSFGPLLMALTLLTARRLIERSSLLRATVFGLVLGLLVRCTAPGWGFVLGGAATLWIARASWRVWAVTVLALLMSAGPALWAGIGTVAPRRLLSLDALLAPGLLAHGGVRGWADMFPPGAAPIAVLAVPAAIVTWMLLAAGTAAAVRGVLHGRLLPALVPAWALLSLAWLAMLPDASALATALPPVALLVATSLSCEYTAARWAAWIGGGALVLLGVATTTLGIFGLEAEAHRQPRISVQSQPGAMPAPTSLRDWWAVVDTAEEVARRVGVREVIVVSGGTQDPAMLVASVLPGEVSPRFILPNVSILPLEHELAYLVLAGQTLPIGLDRVSSSTAAVTASGADTGARLLTLRPRPPDDWLSQARPIHDGRFKDGSILLAVAPEQQTGGGGVLLLYWQLATESDGRGPGVQVALQPREVAPGVRPPRPAALPMLLADHRRQGEIVVLRLPFPAQLPVTASRDLRVTLLDADGRVVPTTSGEDGLDLPSGVGSPGPGGTSGAAAPTPEDRLRSARALVETRQYEEALAALARLERENPSLPGLVDLIKAAHLGYGQALLGREQFDQSYAQFQALLARDPENQAAKQGQQQALLRRAQARLEAAWGRDDLASTQALEEMLQLDPNNNDTKLKLYVVLLVRADKLREAGKLDEGLPLLERALQLNPNGSEVQERLRLYATPLPPTRISLTPRPLPAP